MDVKSNYTLLKLSGPKSSSETNTSNEINFSIYKSKDVSLEDLVCLICKKQFLSKIKLQQHYISHSEGNPFNCFLCEKSFKTRKLLQCHIITHRKKKSIPCYFCPKKFSSKKSFEHHLLIHSGRLSHECEVCHRKFRTKLSLQTHTLVVHKKQKDDCPTSRKKFSWKSTLTTHLKTHEEKAVKSYDCVKCGKFFKYKNNLARHNLKCEKNDVQCCEVLALQEAYKIECMGGLKKHECSVCKKQLSTEEHLKRHVIIHAEKTDFQCVKCDKYFRDPYALCCHERLHTEERSLQCKMCINSFKLEEHLKLHLKTHSDIKPFACIICKVTFKQAEYLKRHILRFHRDSKTTYVCSVCQTVFSDVMSLQKHLRFSAVKSYCECGKCYTKFKSQRIWKTHSKTHINNKSSPNQDISPSCFRNEDVLPTRKNNSSEMFETKVFESDSSVLNSHNFPLSDSSSDEKTESLKTEQRTDDEHFKTSDEKVIVKPPMTNEDVDKGSIIKNIDIANDNKTYSLRSTRQTFVCPECGFKFRDLVRLEQHVSLHKKKKAYQKSESKTVADLKKRRTHKQPFKDKPKLDDHILLIDKKNTSHGKQTDMDKNIKSDDTTLPSLPIKSDDNIVIMSDPSSFDRDDSNEESRETSMCNKSLKKILKRSKNTTGDSPNCKENFSFQCEVCDKSFPSFKLLKSHSLNHSGEKPFQCDLCDQSFNRKYRLAYHILSVHRDVKEFVCSICKKAFAFYSSLIGHMKTHSVSKPVLQCHICKLDFEGQHDLREHHFAHVRKNGVFPCILCHKVFRRRNNLVSHYRSHSDEKPFKCKLCEAQFKYPKSLRKHKNNHQDDRHYVCKYCNDSFRTRSSHKTHISNYHQNRQFVCEICDKGFAYRASLALHMSSHTDDRPYVCETCNKSFKYHSGLRRHLLNHEDCRLPKFPS